jgi:hypothetical protein
MSYGDGRRWGVGLTRGAASQNGKAWAVLSIRAAEQRRSLLRYQSCPACARLGFATLDVRSKRGPA